jgi:putative ABC transport system permease protein
MILTLAWATLARHRSRTLLAILGVAVSAAMLLDMVMLSSGMRASFRSLLLSRGFQIRIAPKGTLPFDTDATIADASSVARIVRTDPDVEVVSPVLGGQLHVVVRDAVQTAIALGVQPEVQGDYALTAGTSPRRPNEVVVSSDFLRATGARMGDTIVAAGDWDVQHRSLVGRRALVIVGTARFIYLPTGARALALPLSALQTMRGDSAGDRASLFMIRARHGADIEMLRQRIERALPHVTVVSIASAMRQVDERLSYFRQLAVILGAVSLAVGFLLVTTLVTVSVNERLGEIVVMRAIGVARRRVVLQIVLEGTAIMVCGAIVGLGLGLVTARYLNSILATFPGLPAAIDFFLFEPKDAWTALGLLMLAGILAGIYPSWRGASRPIAATLREEAVS